MVGGRAWEVVLTWGRVPNWGGGVGRQPRAHAQAHAHAFDAFVPPLFFFLQRFFGDFATQSQSRVLPFFALPARGASVPSKRSARDALPAVLASFFGINQKT